MTRYFTFLDSNSAEGIETILSVQENGSEFGVGITSAVQMDNFSVLNSVGIGTTQPISELEVVGDVNISGIVTANTFVGDLVGIVSTAIYATTAGISTVSQGISGSPNIIVGVTTIGLTNLTSPPSNSQMSFELTDNNTLTIRVRGTDGVVRSGIVKLT
jgi:hypothetical protein